MFNVIMFFCFSLSVWAEGPVRMRTELFGASSKQDVNSKSDFNQNNRILKIPHWELTLEVRPEFLWDFSDLHSAVLRSRHIFYKKESLLKNPDDREPAEYGESDLSDLYLSSNWSATFNTTVGLQNFQWGPAEVFSPTNPFFHFKNEQKGFFYKEKGRALIRGNWNPNSLWTTILLHEPISNREKNWVTDISFSQKSAFIFERQFSNPINSFAFVLGHGENKIPFVGEYFNYSPTEGQSLYADMKHSDQGAHYLPQMNSFGGYDLELATKTGDLKTLAVLGYRWEGRVDFRQEFIWNEFGYNREQWKNAKLSATILAPRLAQNATRFSAPGLEFRTQKYSYTSLRVPDVGEKGNSALSIRWLQSFLENSAIFQFNFEHNWNDSTVVIFEWNEFSGNQGSEFRLAANRQISAGGRYTW